MHRARAGVLDLGLEKRTSRGFYLGWGGPRTPCSPDLCSPHLPDLPEHSLASSGPQDPAPLRRLVLSVLFANFYSFFKALVQVSLLPGSPLGFPQPVSPIWHPWEHVRMGLGPCSGGLARLRDRAGAGSQRRERTHLGGEGVESHKSHQEKMTRRVTSLPCGQEGGWKGILSRWNSMGKGREA